MLCAFAYFLLSADFYLKSTDIYKKQSQKCCGAYKSMGENFQDKS